MKGAHTDLFRPEFLRPDRREEIVAIIRAMQAPRAWKRSMYLRWLLAAKIEYQPGDLDDVIATRPRLSVAVLEDR